MLLILLPSMPMMVLLMMLLAAPALEPCSDSCRSVCRKIMMQSHCPLPTQWREGCMYRCTHSFRVKIRTVRLTRPALPREARPPLPARPVPRILMEPEDGLLFGFVWLCPPWKQYTQAQACRLPCGTACKAMDLSKHAQHNLYLGNGAGDFPCFGITLNNFLHIAASMAAFVVAAWVRTPLHCLLSIPVDKHSCQMGKLESA